MKGNSWVGGLPEPCGGRPVILVPRTCTGGQTYSYIQTLCTQSLANRKRFSHWLKFLPNVGVTKIKLWFDKMTDFKKWCSYILRAYATLGSKKKTLKSKIHIINQILFIPIILKHHYSFVCQSLSACPSLRPRCMYMLLPLQPVSRTLTLPYIQNPTNKLTTNTLLRNMQHFNV